MRTVAALTRRFPHAGFRVLLVLAAVAIYARSLGYELLTGDDRVNIWENPSLLRGDLAGIWSSPQNSLYIPVTYTVWLALSRVSSALLEQPFFPGVFRLFNLLVHAGSGLLVFEIARRLLGAARARESFVAFLAALLFVAHPLQVESVAWATGLKDLLAGFFSLSAILLSLPAPAARPLWGSPRGAAVTLAYLLAMASKPSALLLPLALLGTHAVLLAGQSWKAPAKAFLPLLLLGLPFAMAARAIQPDSTLVHVPSLWQRPLVALDAIAFYAFKLAWPLDLAADYARTPARVFVDGSAYWTWAPAAFLCATAVRLRRRHPWLASAGLVALAGLLPVLGLVPFSYQDFSTVADRYLHFPMAGVSIGLAFALRRRRIHTRLVALAALAFLALLSARQTRFWADPRALAEHALAVQPETSMGNRYRASELERAGKLEESLPYHRRAYAVSRRPLNYAAALEALGRVDEAVALHRGTLREFPRHPDAPYIHLALGTTRLKRGDPIGAGAEYAEALRLRPGFASAHYNLGLALEKQGKRAEARKAFDAANAAVERTRGSDPLEEGLPRQ